MKVFGVVVGLAALASAAPTEIVERGTGNTATELENGPCKQVTLIFARGSTEAGNMGGSVGPALCDAMKAYYGAGNVACQGVGGPYTASIFDNLQPKGTSAAAIGEATRLFNLAASKCPSTSVVASGYSQGGAVMHGSISTLAGAVQSMIDSAVMFGDSRNSQDHGRIPNFPTSKTKIFCAFLDAVCMGTDLITLQHLTYTSDIGSALSFIKSLD